MLSEEQVEHWKRLAMVVIENIPKPRSQVHKRMFALANGIVDLLADNTCLRTLCQAALDEWDDLHPDRMTAVMNRIAAELEESDADR